MQIISGKIPTAKKVVVYGPEGIGKSTFASCFPDPLFIDTEGSTKEMDIKRLPAPTSWSMIKEEVQYILANPCICKTLVVDTADWAESLCSESICDGSKKTGIEDFGYGKGYIYLAEEFGRLLNLLNDVVEKGINIVFTAHATMRKFEQPDEMGAYDRWEMKLQKKTAPLLKEWADIVLFANYKTYVVATDNKGDKHKAQGGKRVMYTTHHSCWDAKNRYGLPSELDFAYGDIAHIFTDTKGNEQITSTPPPEPPVIEEPAPMPAAPTVDTSPTEPTIQAAPPTQTTKYTPTMETITESNCPPSLMSAMKDLTSLVNAAGLGKTDIQWAVESRGYFPAGTSIPNYGEEFIRGMLIRNWEQVKDMILTSKDCQNIFGGNE